MTGRRPAPATNTNTKTYATQQICFQPMKLAFEPLFGYCDGFLRSVVHGMTPYLALPKEILIAQNVHCDKIYLMIRGKVHILTSSRDKYLVTDTIEVSERASEP